MIKPFYVQTFWYLVLAFMAFTAYRHKPFFITLLIAGSLLYGNSLYVHWRLYRWSKLVEQIPDEEVRRLVYKESVKTLSNQMWINIVLDKYRQWRSK